MSLRAQVRTLERRAGLADHCPACGRWLGGSGVDFVIVTYQADEAAVEALIRGVPRCAACGHVRWQVFITEDDDGVPYTGVGG
jgi:hypothetical protein